jgi:hypothetical protein
VDAATEAMEAPAGSAAEAAEVIGAASAKATSNQETTHINVFLHFFSTILSLVIVHMLTYNTKGNKKFFKIR